MKESNPKGEESDFKGDSKNPEFSPIFEKKKAPKKEVDIGGEEQSGYFTPNAGV